MGPRTRGFCPVGQDTDGGLETAADAPCLYVEPKSTILSPAGSTGQIVAGVDAVRRYRAVQAAMTVCTTEQGPATGSQRARCVRRIAPSKGSVLATASAVNINGRHSPKVDQTEEIFES